MAHHPTPLKFLGPGWFSVVMGLCGLSLAWVRASTLLGETAIGAALVIGILAGASALALALSSLVRWLRYPQAWAEDLNHPVRHVFVAAMPIALILLATVLTALTGVTPWARGVWMLGAVWQFWVTVGVLARWLDPSVGGNKPGATFWPGITPALLMPVVGNVLTPLAGVTLGFDAWSAAQAGVGVLMWPVVLALLLVRVGVVGLWPERLLPTTFITVAPPAVIGLASLQLGAPTLLAWMFWGVALLFVLWSFRVFKRSISQPFAIPFWGMSFPLAAFAALTLRLSEQSAAWFQVLAMLVLALASLVVAALALATLKGLREGSLLAPEPIAMISTAVSAEGVQA